MNNAPQVATVIPSFHFPIYFVVTGRITVARLRPSYGLFLGDIDIRIAIACGSRISGGTIEQVLRYKTLGAHHSIPRYLPE